MANVTIPLTGPGGDVTKAVATDTIGAVEYQRVKVSIGGTGTAVDASSANPFPISDNAGSLTVDAASATFTAGVTPTGGAAQAVTAASATFTAGVTPTGGAAQAVTAASATFTVGTTPTQQVATAVSAASATFTAGVSPTAGSVFPVSDNSASLTVDATSGTFVAAVTPTAGVVFGVSAASANMLVTVRQDTANNLKVDASGVAVPVTDNAGSLTVDAASATFIVATNWAGNSVYSATALSATVRQVSSAAGTFNGGMFINLNSAPIYIQVFAVSATADVTLGTTVPTFVMPIPANSTAANGVAFIAELPRGVTMAKGICVAATTTATGNTGPTTALIGFFEYR